MALSSFVIVASLIGMCSAFFTRGGADWCYQGMWYVENNKSVEITNVDYYYTMFNRNIEVPETLKGKDVVSFKVEHHSDIYSVVNVSERLKTITIDSCSNIKSVTEDN